MKPQKTCKNPECGQAITAYKSSKRLYCDDSCKNRANYLIRTTVEASLLAMDKAMRKNHKILKRLRDLNLGPISHQTLVSHGFDFGAIHKAEPFREDDGKMVQLYHVYDIYFEMTNNTLIIKN
jgi:hypothetical protein